MKAFKIMAFWILISSGAAINAQNKSDSLGRAGDNLDLNAVLTIFKDSKNVEDFEKKLNSADTKVNNLDLNHDGQVDYLRVTDYGRKDLHSVIIKDPVSASESQDVAVIEVEKKGKNKAYVQIVGDEDLYGKNYIITPSQKNQEEAEQDNQDDVYYTTTLYPYVNVWGWPCVAYMYSPAYVFWVSPWYWGYYPGWWSPWRPYGWWAYRQGLGNFYYAGYRRTYINHMPMAHRAYYNHRVTSGYVEKLNPPVNTMPRYNNTRNNNNRPIQQNQPGRYINRPSPGASGGWNRGGMPGGGGRMGGGHMSGGGGFRKR